MSLRFLGQTFDNDAAFRQAYPAYSGYVPIVLAGADTPLKVEVELWRRNRHSSAKSRVGTVRKRRAA